MTAVDSVAELIVVKVSATNIEWMRAICWLVVRDDICALDNCELCICFCGITCISADLFWLFSIRTAIFLWMM